MIIDIVKGISVPFLGTTLGAFCVFFLKNELSKGIAESINWICSRCDGGGFYLESSSSGT